MTHTSSAIVLGMPPGRRRDSLVVLLRMAPGVDKVVVADDLSVLIAAVQTHRPGAVVVETTFDAGRIWLLPSLLEATENRTRLVYIVTNGAESERAQRSGAAAVLMRGFTVADLHRALGPTSAPTA